MLKITLHLIFSNFHPKNKMIFEDCFYDVIHKTTGETNDGI